MNLAYKVVLQVIIMFVLIMLGFIITKLKMFNEEGKAQFSEILVSIVTPCVIINAFQVEFQVSLAKELLLVFLGAILIHVIAIIIGHLLYKKSPIDSTSIVYSNCGFMAIPLLEAVLGNTGVFFGAAYIAVFNALVWTHGVYVFTKGNGLSIKKVLFNPGTVGVAIGLALFFLQIRLPHILLQPIQYMAGLNTPVAMLLLGAFLANVKFGSIFKNIRLYIVSVLRLLVLPIVSMFILKLMPLGETAYMSLLILSACPVATMIAILAQRYNLDSGYASQIVAINTVVSIFTIPLIVYISSFIH